MHTSQGQTTGSHTTKWLGHASLGCRAVVYALLLALLAGCAEPTPSVVQETSEYTYEEVMERMAAEEAASIAEREE